MALNPDYIVPLHHMDENEIYIKYDAVVLDSGYGIMPSGGYGYINYKFEKTCDIRKWRLKNPTIGYITEAATDYLSKYYTKNSSVSRIKDVTPPEGSTLFVAPGCPVPIDDLRKHYNIKRDIHSAEYVVISKKVDVNNAYNFKTFLWTKEKFAIVVTNEEGLKFLNQDKNCKTISAKGIETINNCLGTSLTTEPDVVLSQTQLKYLSSTNKEAQFIYSLLECPSKDAKFVFIDNCLVGSAIPLTLDTFKVMMATATKPWSTENGASFAASLCALNQTTWRDFPGTLSRFGWHLGSSYSSTYTETTRSRLPKAAVPVWDAMHKANTPFLSEEDYNMFLSWAISINNIKDTKFITRQELNEISTNIQSSGYSIYDMYSICVRVKPRTYKEYLKATNVQE